MRKKDESEERQTSVCSYSCNRQEAKCESPRRSWWHSFLVWLPLLSVLMALLIAKALMMIFMIFWI